MIGCFGWLLPDIFLKLMIIGGIIWFSLEFLVHWNPFSYLFGLKIVTVWRCLFSAHATLEQNFISDEIFGVVYRLFSDELLYSEMRLSYLSISFGIGIYFIIWFEKCFEMETKHLLVELFSWLQNPKNIFWGFFWLAGKILRLSIVWTVEDDP